MRRKVRKRKDQIYEIRKKRNLGENLYTQKKIF